MSKKELSILTKKHIILDVKGTCLKPCSHCLSGNAHKHAIHSSPSRKKNILDLIHTDVYSIKTLGGALYFVTFIDDHSRKVWAFALKFKDQVLDLFKHFYIKVERETGKH